jgi:hypothetical protein
MSSCSKADKKNNETECINLERRQYTSEHLCIPSDNTESSERPDKAMEETYDRLATEAIHTLDSLGEGKRLWIGLAGAPGSGKSTVGDAVIERIQQRGIQAKVVPMDGWHYSQDEMHQKGHDMKRRGAPWTMNAEQMANDLQCAISKECCEVDLPVYSRETSNPVPNQIHVSCSDRIIIVEGLYVLLGLLLVEALTHDAYYEEAATQLGCPHDVLDEVTRWKCVTGLWNQTWFVAPPEGFEENKRRLIERSLKTWTDEKTERFGGGTPEKAAERRVETNDAKNGRLVTCCQRYADIQIDSL